MRHLRSGWSVVAVAAALLAPAVLPAAAAGPASLIGRRPEAVVDLRTAEGTTLVRGSWRFSDASVIASTLPAPGPERRPTGAPRPTLDVSPAAGGAAFDDSAWAVLNPASLEERRGAGKLSFAWYRIRVTIPERVGEFRTAGSTVVFEVVVDDYAEVWIDGSLPRQLGQPGGSVIGGFNAPNRIVAARGVVPGQEIQIAVFAINGPLSDPPSNWIWIRSATLDFHAPGPLRDEERVGVAVERADPGLESLLPSGVAVERLATGFTFAEGPVWSPAGRLYFSDPDDNTIYTWDEVGGASVFRVKSGYTGPDIGRYHQPGSNGLGFDSNGRLTICEHGNRRVTRLENNGTVTVLADRYQGMRLNSPNDLVYASDGALYFTDPPFGLPGVFDDPGKELTFSGVYRLKEGRLDLVDASLSGPNGVALSPDESWLYVTNWDPGRKIVQRYPIGSDGKIGEGSMFFDMKEAPEAEALDGLEIDRAGNLYVSGPGGIWIISAGGRLLGIVRLPELPSNFAWGDDGSSLYITARTGLYRMRLDTRGAAFGM
jgi:gluconolactonase